MNKFIFVLAFFCVCFSCKDEHDSNCPDEISENNIPQWLTDKINELKKDDLSGAEIDELKYAWGKAIFINPCTTQCADFFTYIYDFCGNQVCTMGGFAGINNCPEAYRLQSEKTVIWKE